MGGCVCALWGLLREGRRSGRLRLRQHARPEESCASPWPCRAQRGKAGRVQISGATGRQGGLWGCPRPPPSSAAWRKRLRSVPYVHLKILLTLVLETNYQRHHHGDPGHPTLSIFFSPGPKCGTAGGGYGKTPPGGYLDHPQVNAKFV